ncbi:MAG: 4'-phosphopantetheinyl transferase superfamily protein [Ruminococcaceae bacterium]|nr:4'-phosphopantetheinyl transferase superfamily protein [Oscillospiraceae bacterium]
MNYSIWQVSQTKEQVLKSAYFYADARRQAHIASLKTPFAQKQSLCGDALVRQMLSDACHISPSALLFSREENGKPFALNCNLFFNLSHSGDHVLCAVHDAPIGADIEEFRPVHTNLIRKICSAQEIEWIGQDAKRFLRVWTAKEAYLKYLGIGLRTALQDINVISENKLQIDNVQIFSQLTEHYAMSIIYK